MSAEAGPVPHQAWPAARRSLQAGLPGSHRISGAFPCSTGGVTNSSECRVTPTRTALCQDWLPMVMQGGTTKAVSYGWHMHTGCGRHTPFCIVSLCVLQAAACCEGLTASVGPAPFATCLPCPQLDSLPSPQALAARPSGSRLAPTPHAAPPTSSTQPSCQHPKGLNHPGDQCSGNKGRARACSNNKSSSSYSSGSSRVLCGRKVAQLSQSL